MKDDGFHRTKTKPNEKLLLLKLKNEKLMLTLVIHATMLILQGRGISPQPFF